MVHRAEFNLNDKNCRNKFFFLFVYYFKSSEVKNYNLEIVEIKLSIRLNVCALGRREGEVHLVGAASLSVFFFGLYLLFLLVFIFLVFIYYSKSNEVKNYNLEIEKIKLSIGFNACALGRREGENTWWGAASLSLKLDN